MGMTFCPQARRFSAAILTDCKGKQRSMRAKRPLRRVRNTYGNTAQFPPNGLSTAPAAAALRIMRYCLIKVTYYSLFASSVSSWSHTALKL